MGSEKSYPIQKHREGAVQLHENGLHSGSLIAQSVSRLNAEQAQTLLVKAGEEALRLEVKNREQNIDFEFGKRATEDHIGTFNMLDKSGKTMRQTVISDIKTGAGNMRIESKSGAACFVASVAYDDPNHPDVMFLRGFRDNVLVNYKTGRIFINWYWRNGPKLARVVSRSNALRKLSKAVISQVVELLKHLYACFELIGTQE